MSKKTPTLLDDAWELIANVSNGDWQKQSSQWRKLAGLWRQKYFEQKSAKAKKRALGHGGALPLEEEKKAKKKSPPPALVGMRSRSRALGFDHSPEVDNSDVDEAADYYDAFHADLGDK